MFPYSSGSTRVAKINQKNADTDKPKTSVNPIVVNPLILFNFIDYFELFFLNLI